VVSALGHELFDEHVTVVTDHFAGDSTIVVLVPNAFTTAGEEPLVADHALFILILEVVSTYGPPTRGMFAGEVGGRDKHDPPSFPDGDRVRGTQTGAALVCLFARDYEVTRVNTARRTPWGNDHARTLG
jgi:hypothetical protein